MKNLKFEPVALSEAVRAVVLAAVAFGLDWSTEQVGAFMIAVGALFAAYTRSKVTPVSKPESFKEIN